MLNIPNICNTIIITYDENQEYLDSLIFNFINFIRKIKYSIT